VTFVLVDDWYQRKGIYLLLECICLANMAR
jgi:hypothetical protein